MLRADEPTEEEFLKNLDLTKVEPGTTFIGGDLDGLEKSKAQIRDMKDKCVKTSKDWTQKRRCLRSAKALLRTPLLFELDGREIAQG